MRKRSPDRQTIANDSWHPSITAARLLSEARSHLRRLTPQQALEAMRRGDLLVDIRPETQRQRDGVIPESVFVERNVLEWRCDPNSRWRDPDLVGRPLMIICNEGYQSSLAAATIQRFTPNEVTDVIGGFQAWLADGLPVSPSSAGPSKTV